MADIELPSNGSMSVTEVTGLVQLFNNSLLAMEGRLVAKMDDNSRLASERWLKHDNESEKTLKEIERKFERLESEFCKQTSTIAAELKAHVQEAQLHWDKEHEEDLIFDARLSPIRNLLKYLQHNWKTILLIIVSLLAILGFSVNTFETILEQLTS